MIVSTAYFYNFYVKQKKDFIKQNREEFKRLYDLREIIIKRILRHKSLCKIFQYSRLKLQTFTERIKVPENKDFYDIYSENIQECFDLLIDYNIVINKINKDVDECKNSIISYEVYSYVIKEFNGLIRHKIVYDNYNYKLPNRQGIVKPLIVEIDLSKRENFYTDKKATEKLKNEILSRGGTLYDEQTNPSGERYIIYYIYKWLFKVRIKKMFKGFYSFRPNENFMRMVISEYRKDNSFINRYEFLSIEQNKERLAKNSEITKNFRIEQQFKKQA